MKSILFVDDDTNVLDGLRRMLFVFSQEWHTFFEQTGAGALELLKKQHIDIIVTDMQMPGMSGAQLLAEVRKRHPDTLRFVLSGQTDSETICRSLNDVHQYIAKPCKPEFLKQCIDKAFTLRNLLENEHIKSIAAQIGTLPPVPQVYINLCETLRFPDCSIATVGRIIEKDPAMTAKILQLVNSAFFGLGRHVSTAAQAASFLGIEKIKSLVLVTGAFSPLQETKLPDRFSIESLWNHSVQVATYAQAICASQGANLTMQSDAYTAGLLHDTGELLLATACHEDYVRCYDYAALNAVRLVEAEKSLLDCTHAEIGAYLMGIWGLPSQIVAAIAFHHRPSDCPGEGFSVLSAVHIADAFAHDSETQEASVDTPYLDSIYLRKIGLEGRRDDWGTACLRTQSKCGAA